MVKRSFLDWWPPNENENLLLLDSRHQQLPWILAKKFIDFAPSKYSTKNISLDHQKLVFVPYLKNLSAPFPPSVNCACRITGQYFTLFYCYQTFITLLLTQVSANTREHSSVWVANRPKGTKAVQTDWADRSDRFLGFRWNWSSRGITITLTWWRTARFTSKSAKR